MKIVSDPNVFAPMLSDAVPCEHVINYPSMTAAVVETGYGPLQAVCAQCLNAMQQSAAYGATVVDANSSPELVAYYEQAAKAYKRATGVEAPKNYGELVSKLDELTKAQQVSFSTEFIMDELVKKELNFQDIPALESIVQTLEKAKNEIITRLKPLQEAEQLARQKAADLESFRSKCQNFDWNFGYTTDQNAWQQGEQNFQNLKNEAMSSSEKTSIFNEYSPKKI